MESIKDALHCKGVPGIDVRDMGGLRVALTFSSVEQMEFLFNGGELSWLNTWIEDATRWSPDLMVQRRSNVWISVYGVPLHGWSCATFIKIAQRWGEIIHVDETTVKGLSFAAGKVMIATEYWDRINEVAEQVVVQGHCFMCNYNSTESNGFLNSPIEVESNARRVESVDEANSRRWEEPRVFLVGVDMQKSDSVVPESLSAFGVRGGETLIKLPGSVTVTGAVVRSGEVSGARQRQSKLGNTIGGGVFEGVVGDGALDFGPVFEPIGKELPAIEVNSVEVGLVDGPVNIDFGVPAQLNDNFGPGPSNYLELGLIPNTVVSPDGLAENKKKDGTSHTVKKRGNPVRKLKPWEDILGPNQVNQSLQNHGRRKKKTKQVIFRSAIAAASLSFSSEGIRNRNRLYLDEAQAIWAMGNIVEGKADGPEEEIISKLAEAEEDRERKKTDGDKGIFS